MKAENFEKAKIIQSHIELLEKKIKSFDKSHKWVHLNISDHYGNRRDTIETYAFPLDYRNAAGSELEDFIPTTYGEFLESVKTEMQKRIDFLKSEFNKL